MADLKGEYTKFRALEPLPPLVRKQRRLEAKLYDEKGSFVEQEKAVRKDIDALLLAAGLQKGEGVGCLGYDVVHRERAGQSSIDGDKLLELLVAGGVERVFAARAISEATNTGDPAKYAEVKPSKGAKVRAA